MMELHRQMNKVSRRVSPGMTRDKVLRINDYSDELSLFRWQQKLSKTRKVWDESGRFLKSEEGEFSFEPLEELSRENRKAIFTDALYVDFEKQYDAA
jgi:hypothetical protein